MNFFSAAALALTGCLVGFSATAQGTAMYVTPTTKILAIGTTNPGRCAAASFAGSASIRAALPFGR
ncbi:30S ribosomal protein S5 (fragment) [Rhizobium mesoamericanum STM3625]|uniref:30S ribosomal protein S5 n=1 Tax=Rhizobium mesoamericanum STM3625 TaxID=1211777 RepID=K0Q2Q6_9HYPH